MRSTCKAPKSGFETLHALPFGGERLAFRGKFTGQPVAFGCAFSGQPLALGNQIRLGRGQRGDAIVEIADLGIAGDQLQPELGGRLAARIKIGLGCGELAGAFGQLPVAHIDFGTCGCECRLAFADRRVEAGNAFVEPENRGGHFLLGGGQGRDLVLLAAHFDRLAGEFLAEVADILLQPPGGDGEIGPHAVLVGLDLGAGHRHAGFDAGAHQTHRPPPDRRRHDQHQQACRQQAEREIHYRLDQRPALQRRPSTPPDVRREGSWPRHVTGD